MNRYVSASGFTLIELSIVLVIIGLIVGGVLTGRSLIRAAELRGVISQVERFNTAAISFEGKYDCLPGDCTNVAASIADHIQGGFPLDASGNYIWNGNGDGIIDGVAYCAAAAGSNNHGMSNVVETWGFWHHLGISGMIPTVGSQPGAYVCGPTSCSDSMVGTDIPVSVLGGSTGFSISGAHPIGGAPGGDLYSGVTGNVFILGTQDTAVNNANYDACQYAGPWLPALSPADARSIDSKIDDGKPGSGAVTAFQPTGHYNPTCVSGTDYNIMGSATLQCTMVFQAAF